MEIKRIGYLKTPFKEKFGLPRQAGTISLVPATLVFEGEYKSKEALSGLDGFSHVWVIWGFSECEGAKFSPTVRPPRLGGNKRVGVFASRSPYRPNSLALSLMRLEGIEKDPRLGYVLKLRGADMIDGSPVYDIKPYVKYADSVPDSKCGFTDTLPDYLLKVDIPSELKGMLTDEEATVLISALAEDPRPSYIENDERAYGLLYLDYEVKFKVSGRFLTVISIENAQGSVNK